MQILELMVHVHGTPSATLRTYHADKEPTGVECDTPSRQAVALRSVNWHASTVLPAAVLQNAVQCTAQCNHSVLNNRHRQLHMEHSDSTCKCTVKFVHNVMRDPCAA